MKTAMTFVLTCAGCLVMLAAPAAADWFDGEPHKMHFPQLPDPTGWDVSGTVPNILADDWQCSETGPVSDVHIWGSWHSDIIGEIAEIRVGIYDNVPAVAGDPTSFSQPGSLLWIQSFSSTDIAVINPYGTGNQGWFDPAAGIALQNDHQLYHQINIENIANPFVQTFGEVYWLMVSLTVVPDPVGAEWGWKTSQDHFMGAATYLLPGATWKTLNDPITTEPLDLAFVITPEPTSLALLLGCGLLMVRRRAR